MQEEDRRGRRRPLAPAAPRGIRVQLQEHLRRGAGVEDSSRRHAQEGLLAHGRCLQDGPRHNVPEPQELDPVLRLQQLGGRFQLRADRPPGYVLYGQLRLQRPGLQGRGPPPNWSKSPEPVRIKKRPSRNAQILDSWDGVEREVDDPKRRMSTQALIDSEEQV